MIYNYLPILVFSLVFSLNHSDAITMKTRMSSEGESILIQLELPQGDHIGFQLIEPEGDIVFTWNEKHLTKGYHDLKLDLPKNAKGKFLLRLMSTDQRLDQLVFIAPNKLISGE